MSRPVLAILLLTLTGCQQESNAQEKSPDRQVTEAISPLPEALRVGATVLGYRDGELVTLREGAGSMTCLADDPADDRWHVACYHNSLEPFMARGRELRAGGAEREQVDSVRAAEIASGELEFPDHPAALYRLDDSPGSFDPATGPSDEARRLFVVYTPYATPDELGLSAEPSRERPWLMFPGKPWAHIMVVGK